MAHWHCPIFSSAHDCRSTGPGLFARHVQMPSAGPSHFDVDLSTLQISTKATFDMNLAALSNAKKRLEDTFGWDLGCRLCDYGMIKNIGENVKAQAESNRLRFVATS